MTGRNANGESSIYQDAKGRWHGKVSMGRKDNGAPDRRHVSGRTRREVVAKVRELEAKREAGTSSTAGRQPTFGAWLDHWLTITRRSVRPSTYTGYESYVRNHIKPALGHHRLDRLQPEHLENLYAMLVDKGLSPAMQLQQHRVISRALKIAMQRGRVARNVATLVAAPTLTRTEVVPFTADEARRVLQAAAGRRNAARWSVALAMGCRQGEALGARWDDVDLDAGTWRVTAGLQRQAYRHGCGGECADGVKPLRCPKRTGGLVFVPPKSDRGKRTIAIPTPLVAALKAHRQAQLAERLAAGPMWRDLGLVFATPTGGKVDPRRDWAEWKELLVEAGLRDARLHDARHTAATLLLEQGVDARVVMEILGHSQISLTQNTYQHVMPKVVADATERVAGVLFGPTVTTTGPPPRRLKSS